MYWCSTTSYTYSDISNFHRLIVWQTFPSQHVRILIECCCDWLEIMPLKVAIAINTTGNNPVQDFSCHTSETDLEIVFLDLHVDKYRRKRTNRDHNVGIVFFCQSDQAFEDLLFGLKHTVYLLEGEICAVVTMVDISIDHIRSTEEMEDVRVRFRFITQHIECVLK